MKRTTKKASFLRLAAAGLTVSLAITGASSLGIYSMFNNYLEDQTISNTSMRTTKIMTMINKMNDREYDDIMAQTENIMTLNSALAGLVIYAYPPMLDTYLEANHTDDYRYIVALLDDDGNILASNKKKFNAVIKYQEGESLYYGCNPDYMNIPEFDQLIEDYVEMASKYDEHKGIFFDFVVNDAYINDETRTALPRSGSITLYKSNNRYFNEDGLYTDEDIVEQINFEIPYSGNDMKLLTFHKDNSESPRMVLEGIRGCSQEDYDKYSEYMQYVITNNYDMLSAMSYNDDNYFMSESYQKVYIDGIKYNLCTIALMNPHNMGVMKIVALYSFIIFLITFAISLLICWRKYVKLKARDEFEDYQKCLINNLAHDLKTPLTAIGGYAENASSALKKGNTSELGTYISAISENVFSTDSMIMRTLELNRIGDMKDIKRVPVDLHKLAEEAVSKYALLLEEKNIKTEFKGECTLKGDKSSLTQAVENLISNAVKYTTDGGTITVTADKKSLTVANTISEKVDTKDLTMPFVKGDKARSDKSSSGLGLAIVQNVADLNKMKLKISSTDNTFTATISK